MEKDLEARRRVAELDAHYSWLRAYGESSQVGLFGYTPEERVAFYRRAKKIEEAKVNRLRARLKRKATARSQKPPKD